MFTFEIINFGTGVRGGMHIFNFIEIVDVSMSVEKKTLRFYQLFRARRKQCQINCQVYKSIKDISPML